MPQIAQIAATYASQIFWMLLVFALIYFGIGRAMLPKIEATVDRRDRKIADDLAAAQRARVEADATHDGYKARMESARTEAVNLARAAKTAAAADAVGQVKAADAELAAKADEAEKRLRAALDNTLAGIEEVATDAAQDIVARVSGASVDRAEAASAVKAALASA